MKKKTRPRRDREGKIPVVIHLDKDIHQEMKDIAREQERAMNRMLRRLLTRLVQEHREGRRPFAS